VTDSELPYTVFGDHTRHTKFVDFPFTAGADGTQILKPTTGIDDKFFYYLVSYAGDRIGNYGYDRHFKHLKEFECFIPDKREEQTQIAAILSSIDKTIEQTGAIIEKQTRIKIGLMQDLLTKGIDEDGNIRSEETHEFRDSPLGKIPVEWDVMRLSQCVERDAPICYGILMPGEYVHDGVPVIKVKDMVDGRIRVTDLLLTHPQIDAEYRRSRLREGDILVSIRGTTGRVAIVPPELDGANITQDSARIRLKKEHIRNYFYFLLQSKSIQDQISLHTLGQAVKGINIGEIKRISVTVPRRVEQKTIGKHLRTIDSVIMGYNRELNKLRLAKIGLMQDLLTGKVPVTKLLNRKEELTGAP